MHRFYVPPENVGSDKILLTENAVRHAVKTLRMKPGEKLALFDGSGKEYIGSLVQSGKNEYSIGIEQISPPPKSAERKITLYSAPIKKEHWEWLLEKATELGADTVVPIITKYTEVDITQNFEKKKARWELIAQGAAEQSERRTLMKLGKPLLLSEALAKAPGIKLFSYENEKENRLTSVLQTIAPSEEISIFFGPVGGFAPEEVKEAVGQGARLVSLGPRILRVETAALAALTVLTISIK